MDNEKVVTGVFKDSKLQIPYFTATSNGMLKISDKQGRYIKLYYKNLLYIAENISEDYRGSAFL